MHLRGKGATIKEWLLPFLLSIEEVSDERLRLTANRIIEMGRANLTQSKLLAETQEVENKVGKLIQILVFLPIRENK